MKTHAELEAMNKAELKEYGATLGADTKGNLSEATLIERIEAVQNAPEFVDPEPTEAKEPVELAGRDFVEPTYTTPAGQTVFGGKVLEAAQRDSGKTPEEWNKMKPADMEKAIDAFEAQSGFSEAAEEKEAKTDKDDAKRVEAVFKEFPMVNYKIEQNFFTYDYRGTAPESGNLAIPDEVLRRKLQVLTGA